MQALDVTLAKTDVRVGTKQGDEIAVGAVRTRRGRSVHLGDVVHRRLRLCVQSLDDCGSQSETGNDRQCELDIWFHGFPLRKTSNGK